MGVLPVVVVVAVVVVVDVESLVLVGGVVSTSTNGSVTSSVAM